MVYIIISFIRTITTLTEVKRISAVRVTVDYLLEPGRQHIVTISFCEETKSLELFASTADDARVWAKSIAFAAGVRLNDEVTIIFSFFYLLYYIILTLILYYIDIKLILLLFYIDIDIVFHFF